MLHILTLSYNGKDKLKELRPGLTKAVEGLEHKWWIKDNGGNSNGFTDDLANINYIRYPHNNDTFSYGCNFLFNEAHPNDDDFILLLNNDIVFADDSSIKNMISMFKDDVGVVGARLLYKNTNKLQHAGVVFSRQGLPFNYRRNEENDEAAEMNREFQAVTAAALLTKAKYYRNICTTNKSKMNGLDENYFWCFEDVSATLSIKYDMNKKIIYCGNTKIFHEESATLKINPVNKLYMKHNVNYFLNKWFNKTIKDMPRYMSDPKYNLI